MNIEVYKDKKGELRWRALAKNNKIIATGGEGYKNRDDLQNALDLLFKDGERYRLIRDTLRHFVVRRTDTALHVEVGPMSDTFAAGTGLNRLLDIVKRRVDAGGKT